MTQMHCSRCGNDAEGLERAPLPGQAGERVREHACAACWQEWLRTQVMVINEHQLSPADPKHFEFLLEQMRAFLNLPAETSHETGRGNEA